MMASVNVTSFVQQRQIGNSGGRQRKHVESFLEEKGLTSLINKECSLTGHCRSTFNMEFSPDGTKVASTHGDHTVRVTDIATGKCVRTLTGHPRTPWCLAYHPSSSHILASGCLDGQVRIWDLYGQGCEVWHTERSSPIASMTFHPVDHVLVFVSGKTIYFWDWSRPEPFAQCTTKLQYERVRWVKFDPLGHVLYTGISNNTTGQREDASRISVMSQRGATEVPGEQTERLGSLYNNLMNQFQEYRRDQVVREVQSQFRQGSVQSTSSLDPISEVEMYPGVPNSDIVRPTSPEHAQMLRDARQYAAEATQRASTTFSLQVAQATRRATEIGLRELTTRRRTGQSDSEVTENALDSARQYASQLTQQATDRLRHETATGLRLAQYSAETTLRAESEQLEEADIAQRSDNSRRSGNYDLGNLDSELEDRARQVVSDAVERARERERQAAEVRQRAQHSISLLDQWRATNRRLARLRNQNENPSTFESGTLNTGLWGLNTEPASNTEDSGEIQLEDIEINIPVESSNRNFDPEAFTTETYDAELNNILGIETEVSDEAANIEESRGEVNSSAEVNAHFIGSGEEISVSEALSAGLRELENNNSVVSAVMNDCRAVTNVDSSTTDNNVETEILNRRGMWSPPPRHLSPAQLAGVVVGQGGELSHGEETVSQREELAQSEEGGNEIAQCQTDTSKVHMSNDCQSGAENIACSFGTRNQEGSDCQAKQERKSSDRLSDTDNSETENSKSRSDKACNVLSGSSILTRYLQAQKGASGSMVASDNKTSNSVFPSIRERLQTNIPLTSCDSSLKSSSVRVLSSRGKIPVVTVVSASECSTTSSSKASEQSRPVVAGWSDVFRTNAVNVRSGLSTAVSSSNSRSSLNSSTALSSMNYPPIVPTVIASTSSHASLFQNIYHNSRGTYNYNTRGAFGGGQIRNTTLSSSRTQPYLQNRSRFMSLMGPYLESRGVGLNRMNENNADRSTVPSPTATANTFRPSAYSDVQNRVPHLGLSASAVNPPTTQSNILESSDTESELNTHLHNRAYFLPISEDQTRTVSSTSIQSTSSIESSDNVLRQRSVSRDSVDSVPGRVSASEIQGQVNSVADNFVQDMHRFSVNSALESERQRQRNYPRNTNETSLFNRDDNNNDQDDNNNTIHVVDNAGNSAQTAQGPESFLALRDNLVTMTNQIEQEMNELNRRINSLRDSFNQSLQALRQDRERYQSLGRNLTDTNTNLTAIERASRGDNSSREDNSNDTRAVPMIRVTGLEDQQASSSEEVAVSATSEGVSYEDVTVSQPPTLLETSLRSHNRQRLGTSTLIRTSNLSDPQEDSVENIEPHHWHELQRHYLHPHYSRSILDETINRPTTAIQSAINRAIAGALMGTVESAVANNITNQTHRIQFWDFTKLDIPDITNANQNIVVPHCKLHNDASCDISQNGALLATFVPSHHGFPDDNILAVYSLVPSSRGQCLYTKSFGPNAISISISPRNNFVMVGLAAKRLSWVFIRNQMVAQIFKFEKEYAGEKSMKHVTDVCHPCDPEVRMHVSGNAAKWLPTPGHGLVYGTNRGHLRLCRPFCMVSVDKKVGDNDDSVTISSGRGATAQRRRNLLQALGLSHSNVPRTISISTQTSIRGIRQHSGTQTDNSDSD